MRKTIGIDTGVKATVNTPFPVSDEKWKHLAILHSVTAVTDKDKNGEDFDALDFLFMSPDGAYTHNHREFAIKSEDAKYDDKVKWSDQRIAHIFNAFAGEQAHVNVGGKGYALGTPATEGDMSWGGYFAAVARDFNKANNGKPVFTDDKGGYVVVWLKLTFDNRGYLQIPFPNFIEKYVNGRECLSITKGRNESFTAPKKDNPIAGGGGTPGGSTTIKPGQGMPPGF